jgi:hypothetical protein
MTSAAGTAMRKLNVYKVPPGARRRPGELDEVVSTIRSKPTYYRTNIPGF